MHHILMFMPLLALVLFIFFPWPIALALYLPLVTVSLFGYWKVLQALKQPPVTGQGAMIGGQAVVINKTDKGVEVNYQGERWQAVSPYPLSPGQQVVIEEVHGLTLRVAPLSQPAQDEFNQSNQ